MAKDVKHCKKCGSTDHNRVTCGQWEGRWRKTCANCGKTKDPTRLKHKNCVKCTRNANPTVKPKTDRKMSCRICDEKGHIWKTCYKRKIGLNEKPLKVDDGKKKTENG